MKAPVQRVIVLGCGRRVSMGAYIRAILTAKANPNTEFKYGLTGWWPVTGANVMRDFRVGVMDRINQRGGVTIREENTARTQRRLRARVKHDCLWCGRALERYEPRHARFCEPSCARSYNL